MPLGNDLNEQGFDVQLEIDGVLFTVLGETGVRLKSNLPTTGKQFTAIIEPITPIDPSMELGSDWRELSVVHVKRADAPALEMNDRVQDEDGNKWKIVKREDNPADFVTKFWAVFVTEDDV